MDRRCPHDGRKQLPVSFANSEWSREVGRVGRPLLGWMDSEEDRGLMFHTRTTSSEGVSTALYTQYPSSTYLPIELPATLSYAIPEKIYEDILTTKVAAKEDHNVFVEN